ncbi:MAG: class I SAM-dependent methyltransferase [Anaerolineales bacterium]
MNWHPRYLQQAAWTSDLRGYLFEKTGLPQARRVLEIGCGTGAVLSTLQSSASSSRTMSLHGLDLDAAALNEAHLHAATAFLTRGDAHSLPYSNQSFDISYCHFLLLWVDDPLHLLTEMKRVTTSSGYVLALAEPDYAARTDRPEELTMLGKWQNESLQRQGADISIGARLADLFFRAGIRIIETGAIQSRENDALSLEEWQNEWDVIEFDLAESVTEEEIARLKNLDEKSRKDGTRVLNVPTYFAWGQV